MKFLIDKEIDLNKQDFLNTSSYSKALKEVIVSAPADNSFTIGLFGEWGSGKSSIVRTVEEDLITTNKKIKFVIYDAWKYSNDSFRRMFLLKLQQDLNFERTVPSINSILGSLKISQLRYLLRNRLFSFYGNSNVIE